MGRNGMPSIVCVCMSLAYVFIQNFDFVNEIQGHEVSCMTLVDNNVWCGTLQKLLIAIDVEVNTLTLPNNMHGAYNVHTDQALYKKDSACQSSDEYTTCGIQTLGWCC
jgi:hypothetical protein